MIDKNKLHTDLTDLFITYQYRLDCPMPSKTETKEAIILKYRNDPLFHNKVNALVAAVMFTVNKIEREAL